MCVFVVLFYWVRLFRGRQTYKSPTMCLFAAFYCLNVYKMLIIALQIHKKRIFLYPLLHKFKKNVYRVSHIRNHFTMTTTTTILHIFFAIVYVV